MGKLTYKIESANFPNKTVNAPEGWKDDESTFERSDSYKGIFRKFSANELTYREEGAAILREIFAQLSFESEAEFKIYETDFSTYGDFLRFVGSFDFVRYRDINGNEGKSVEITVIDSSFWNTIKNRENIESQLSQLESLDGFQISGFTNEEQFIALPEIPKVLDSSLHTATESSISGGHSIPLIIGSSEDDGARDVSSSSVTDGILGAFYVSTEAYGLVLSIDSRAILKLLSNGVTVNLILKRYDAGDVLVSEEILTSEIGNTSDEVALIYAGDKTFVPTEGDYFLLTVEGAAPSDLFETINIIYYTSVSMKSTSVGIPRVQISGMLVHEALSRSLQLSTGKNFPLYSDLIGGINSEPRSYGSDGDLRNMLITNGERIRQFTKEESPITLSYAKCFEALNAIRPIGAGIESIDGTDTLRLEDLKYFFDNRVVLTIDNASNIVNSVFESKIINQIAVGYSKAEYEKIKGLREFNQQSRFSTPIAVVQNEYKVVSSIRADNNGIYNARLKPKSTFPTEDTRYDLDNFFIVLIKNDTLVLNANFESWVDDNNPTNWVVGGTGEVEKKYLLGSNRLYFVPEVPFFPNISQDIVITELVSGMLKISYASIGDNTLSASGYISITLTTGASTYQLDNTGAWIETAAAKSIHYASVVPTTKEEELQSFSSFSLLYEAIPVVGTVTLVIGGIGGMVIDDVFFGEAQYTAKTTEGFDTVENTPFGVDSFNLDITPARNLRNHGAIIRAGLENRLSQYIKFNSSDKNSTTITKKDSESVAIIENADVQVNDLLPPYFKPIRWEFDLQINKAVIDIINDVFTGETKQKYLGIIKFRLKESNNYTYIWLDSLQTGGESGQGSMVGVEVNLDYITPV